MTQRFWESTFSNKIKCCNNIAFHSIQLAWVSDGPWIINGNSLPYDCMHLAALLYSHWNPTSVSIGLGLDPPCIILLQLCLNIVNTLCRHIGFTLHRNCIQLLEYHCTGIASTLDLMRIYIANTPWFHIGFTLRQNCIQLLEYHCTGSASALALMRIYNIALILDRFALAIVRQYCKAILR